MELRFLNPGPQNPVPEIPARRSSALLPLSAFILPPGPRPRSEAGGRALLCPTSGRFSSISWSPSLGEGLWPRGLSPELRAPFAALQGHQEGARPPPTPAEEETRAPRSSPTRNPDHPSRNRAAELGPAAAQGGRGPETQGRGLGSLPRPRFPVCSRLPPFPGSGLQGRRDETAPPARPLGAGQPGPGTCRAAEASRSWAHRDAQSPPHAGCGGRTSVPGDPGGVFWTRASGDVLTASLKPRRASLGPKSWLGRRLVEGI